jgi:hypothetical protein
MLATCRVRGGRAPVRPEASVLLFMLIALMWLVFDRLYPSSKS